MLKTKQAATRRLLIVTSSAAIVNGGVTTQIEARKLRTGREPNSNQGNVGKPEPTAIKETSPFSQTFSAAMALIHPAMRLGGEIPQAMTIMIFSPSGSAKASIKVTRSLLSTRCCRDASAVFALFLGLRIFSQTYGF